MKICPKCNSEYSDSENICQYCGVSLISKPQSGISIGDGNAISGGVDIKGSSQFGTPNFSLGDANAISGGIHLDSSKTDSHNVDSHNVDSHDVDSHDNNSVTTIDNSVRVEATKSVEQLQIESRSNFISVVSQVLQNGVFDVAVQEKLHKARIQFNVPDDEYEKIVAEFRKNSTQSATVGDEVAVDSVKRAIETCNLDVLKMSYPKLKALSQKTMNHAVQFYTHLVAMTNKSQECANACAFSKTENYWQLFWACVASVKLENENKTILFSQIATFANYPQGNIMLLNAIEYLFAYRKNPSQTGFLTETSQCLQNSESMGISEELITTWCAINALANNESNPADNLQFYCRYTFPELLPPPSIPNIPKQQIPSAVPPPIHKQETREKFIGTKAAKVNLQQMQGFNPLQGLQNMNEKFSTQCNIAGITNTMNASGIVGIQGGQVPPPMPNLNNNQEN